MAIEKTLRFFSAVALLLSMIPADATSIARHELEGVHLPLEKTLELEEDSSENAVSLWLNGAGVRSVSFFGWDVKVYVAGFYSSVPVDSEEEVFDTLSKHSMQLDFTFLRAVNQGRVTDAWQQQLAYSIDEAYMYEGFDEDRDYFISCFGPIKNGGTETVQLLADGRTVVIDQGRRKGVILGRKFQEAFLSAWFGKRSVASDLKDGLLGKIGHFGSKHIDRPPKETVVTVKV